MCNTSIVCVIYIYIVYVIYIYIVYVIYLLYMSTFKQSIGKKLDGNFCNTLLKCVYNLYEEIFCLNVQYT